MENTVVLLTDFIIVLVTLAAVGYALQYLGRKLYTDIKNNVNGCEKAHNRAYKTGFILIGLIILAIISMCLYIKIELFLTISIVSICSSFLIAGYMFDSDFKKEKE